VAAAFDKRSGALLQSYSEERICTKLYLSESMEKIRENLKRATQFEATRYGLEPVAAR